VRRARAVHGQADPRQCRQGECVRVAGRCGLRVPARCGPTRCLLYTGYACRVWQGAVRFPKLLEGRQAKHYIWKKGFTMDVVNRQPFIRYIGAHKTRARARVRACVFLCAHLSGRACERAWRLIHRCHGDNSSSAAPRCLCAGAAAHPSRARAQLQHEPAAAQAGGGGGGAAESATTFRLHAVGRPPFGGRLHTGWAHLGPHLHRD
jgi:hypothetical protein